MFVSDQQLDNVLSLLSGREHVVITAHMSPDGDAMGSALALQHILRENVFAGTEAPEITVVVPNRFPSFLAWIPGAEEVLVAEDAPEKIQEVFGKADLIFILDYCELKRVGLLEPLIEASPAARVLIDHHINPHTLTADAEISHPEVPATAFLVTELFNRLKERGALAHDTLSADTATCLYTGLMTDTGNFAYSNANLPELYRMVAGLIEAGIDRNSIYDSVYNQFTVDRLRFTGYCLYHKMRVFPKFHTALIALSSEELRRFNFQSGDAEGIVNMPLQIADVFYSVFMREDTDKIKISFRSQGDRPVNVYASEIFNGGGHLNAAGGDSHKTLAETVKLFEDTFRKYFR